MATTGSHPAVKLKKHIQFPPDTSSTRRPSNPPSQSDSTSTVAQDGPGAGFNPNRRRSTRVGGVGLLTAAMSLRRMTRRASIVNQEPLSKPVVRFENAYKMSPDEGTEFLTSKAKGEIETLLAQHLHGVTYDAATAPQLAETMAENVKSVVKNLNIPRYKLVSTVVVGERKDQGMETASRCLWNDNTDNFTTVHHTNKSMFAVVTIFAVYYE